MVQQMIIIATTRTRNEAHNIDRFCQCYQWADKVLVADGGSDDDTVTRAKRYKNTSVRIFPEKVHRGNTWRNPQGKHINFLIDWAKQEGADWIIFDDADSVPTKALQLALRDIMEAIPQRVIMLYRLYIWGNDRYFPDMNKSGQSLYAWLTSMSIRAWEGDPLAHRMGGWNGADEKRLEKPLCCLHYFFPDEATVARKKAFREGIGKVPFEPHPLKSFGSLEVLPAWAKIE
jgi:glycosyltransferase involved in cell wall biosynthesis